jgi:hypothetical protein
MRILFERRLEPSRLMAIVVPIASFLGARRGRRFCCWRPGANPIATYKAMFDGAFGTTMPGPRRWSRPFL